MFFFQFYLNPFVRLDELIVQRIVSVFSVENF